MATSTAEDAEPQSLSSILQRKARELQCLSVPSAWSIFKILTIPQLKKVCADLKVKYKSAANKQEIIEALLRQQPSEVEAAWHSVFSDVKCVGVEHLMSYSKRLGLPTTGSQADLEKRLVAHDKTYNAEILELKDLGSSGVNHPRNMAVERRQQVAKKLLQMMKAAAENDARTVPGVSNAQPHAFKEMVAGVVTHVLQYQELWDELLASGAQLLDVTRAWLDGVGPDAAGILPHAKPGTALNPTEVVCISLLHLAIEAHTFDKVHQMPSVPRLLAWGLVNFMARGEGQANMMDLILSLPAADLERVRDSLANIAEGEKREGGLLHAEHAQVDFFRAGFTEFLQTMKDKLTQAPGPSSSAPATPAPKPAAPSAQSDVGDRVGSLVAAARPSVTVTPASLRAVFATLPEEKLSSLDVPLALTALMCLTMDQLKRLAAGIRGLSSERKPGVAQALLLKDAVKIQDVWEALPPSCRSESKLSAYCAWHGLDVGVAGSEAVLLKRLVDLETESLEKQKVLQEFRAKKPESAPDEKKKEIAHEVLSLVQLAFDTDKKRGASDMHASKSHAVALYGLTELLAMPFLSAHFVADEEFEPVVEQWMQLTLNEGDWDLETVRFLLVRLAKSQAPLRGRLQRFLTFCQLSALDDGFEGSNADIAKALSKYQEYAADDLATLKEELNENLSSSTDISQIIDRIELKVLTCLIKAREVHSAKDAPPKRKADEVESAGTSDAAGKGNKAGGKKVKKDSVSTQDATPKGTAVAGHPSQGKAQTKKTKAGPHRETLQEAKDPYPILVGLYNFKGGVGKTTLAINLGVSLRNAGQRTCYVDCDSQCNMTKYFKTGNEAREARSPDDQPTDVEDEDGAPAAAMQRAGRRPRLGSYTLPDGFLADLNVDVCRKGSFDRGGNAYEVTLKEILQEAFRGNPVQGTPGVMEFAAKKDGNNEPMYPDLPDGLYLIPGHQDLSSFLEPKFQQARGNIHTPGQEDAFMVLGGFRKALTEIARQHGIKYMICDFGPTKGVANEVLLASLDLIIPPFMPDFFSASSVSGLLESVMPGLIDMKAIVHGREVASKLNPSYAPYAFFEKPTKLLPFLMTNIKVEGPAIGQRIIRDHAVFFNLVERLVHDEGLEIRRDVRALFLRDSEERMVVPFLKQVTVLFAAAQAIGHPAVDLTRDMVARWYNGTVPTGTMAELGHTIEVFQRLARMVIAVSRKQ